MRAATKYDKTQLIEMMKCFRKESEIPQFQDLDNEEYWNRLLDNMLAGMGIIYYEENIGLIMGVITPSVWCDKTLCLHEIAWYVKPEHRNGTIGYRLLKAFIDKGKELKASGRIKFFVMGKMITSPDIKFTKFGFKKIDETWIQ
jgi:N-acetylglutamate synthase-like GNAT family acetyltransferase